MDDDGGAGVPEWVVTYGDMMSLLLTFFIMLVSLSEVVADNRYRAVVEAIQQYVGYNTAPLGPPGENFPVNSLVNRLQDKLGSFTDQDNGRGGIRTESVKGEDVHVFRTREGVEKLVGRILPFEPGSAELTPEALKRLPEIVRQIAGKPNKIEIRAHAASKPLPKTCPFHNKLDLTYERARRVADYLVQHGIDRSRIRLTAAGDNEPLADYGDRIDLYEDRAEVYISDVFVSEYIGPRDQSD